LRPFAVISMRPVSCFRPSLIASMLLPARPVSTVTQGSAASYEIRDRRSVQRRGCSQRHGLRKLELGSAQQRLVLAPCRARRASPQPAIRFTESPLVRFPAAAAVGRCAPPVHIPPIEQAPAAWYPTNSGSLPPPTPCPPLTAATTALSPTVAAPLSC